MTLTSSSTACSTSPVGACVTTGVRGGGGGYRAAKPISEVRRPSLLLVYYGRNGSGDCVDIHGHCAHEGFEAITLACSVVVLS